MHRDGSARPECDEPVEPGGRSAPGGEARTRREIPFEKWSGAGNDFVLLRAEDLPPDRPPQSLALQICPRRRSVGADGLIVCDFPTRRADFRNSDGSAAAFCGNGARCLGARLLEEVAVERVGFRLGAVDCQAWRLPGTGHELAVTVPVPRRLGRVIPPEVLARALGHYYEQLTTAALFEVGVPHLVLQFRSSPGGLLMDAEPVLRIGAALRRDPFFGGAGTNVDFLCAAPAGERAPWRLRTYERGVEGETLACGTGAVAAGALLLEGRSESDEADVSVELQVGSGDRLRVERKGPVWSLQGPARRVFRGIFALRGA